MYTIEKFLLHLNQGAPPREGFLPPQEGRNPSRGGTGAQYNRRSDLPAKSKADHNEGRRGGAEIPHVVAKAFYNELHQNTIKIH